MGKLHIVKRAAALLLSMLMLMGMYVNTSVAFVSAETETLVNTFEPLKTAISDLVITKKLEHTLGEDYRIPENISFDFEVDLGKSYAEYTFHTTENTTVTADKNGILSLTLKPEQSIGIEGIEVGTVATVTELPTHLPGFAAKDGKDTVTATVNEQTAAIAEITNVYTPAAAEDGISISGTKILKGRDWKEGDQFTVRLEMLDGEEWKTLAVQTVAYDSENPEFARYDFTETLQAMSFENAGIYQFRIYEEKGDMAGLKYDETVHTVTATVGDATMNGVLEIQQVKISAQATARYDAESKMYVIGADFENIYQPAEDLKVNVSAKKTVKVTGTGNLEASDFTFLLKNIESGEEWKAVSGADGLANFELNFTDADAGKTFRYTLTEVDDGKANVTYSKAVYDIQITIMHNAEHQLEAIITQNGMSVESVLAEFENIYHYLPPVEPEKPVQPELPVEPEKPTTPDKQEPDTGDHSCNTFFVWAMSISGIALMLTVATGIICRKRRGR